MYKYKFFKIKTFIIATFTVFIFIEYSHSVPNAGSLLNVEEELRKVNILPVQVPDDKDLINGVSGLNGEKIEVKSFEFNGQKNGFTNEQLTAVIKDLIGKKLSFDDIQNAAKRIQNFYRDEEAIAMLDKFIISYPNHPALDYAHYLKGVVMFKDRGIVKELTMQDISDRDVSQLERSFQALKRMVKLFPESEYADDAANRMTYLMNKICERELHVARYYMKRDAFVAALNRSKYVLENYPQSVHQEEALVISASAYNKLGIYDLEKDVKRVLELNFPDSDFGKQKKEVDVDKWWKFWDIID